MKTLKTCKYFVGLRDSDIENSRNVFDGSITIRGDGKNNNYSMQAIEGKELDWNNPNTDILVKSFNEKIFAKLAQKEQPVKLMYYNSEKSYINEHPKGFEVICRNSLPLLQELNDKFKTRKLLEQKIPMLNYQFVKGADLKKYHIPREFNLVIQEKAGLAGNSTFLLGEHSASRNKTLSELDDDTTYAVSQYQEKNIPLNVHCIVGADQVEVLAPSIQMIDGSNNKFEYSGPTFESNRFLSNDAKQKLVNYSNTICKRLQKMGYRGVLGIDFIYTYNHQKDQDAQNGELYFIEINPRFQGSTKQVDGLLKQSNLPSIFAYNEMAFAGKEMPSTKKMGGWHGREL